MPLESILYLGFVITALAEFAAALSYAEWATRHAPDNASRPAQIRREANSRRGEAAPVREAA